MADTYADSNGIYLGTFEGNTGKVPAGAIKTLSTPSDAGMIYDFNTSLWTTPKPVEDKIAANKVTIEDRVQALWEKAQGDSTKFDALVIILGKK